MYGKDVMVIFVGFIVVVIAVVGAFAEGIPKGVDIDGNGDIGEWLIEIESPNEIPGYSTENSQTVVDIEIGEEYTTIFEITFTLTWTDEDDYSPGEVGVVEFTNEPDQFALEVISPWWEEANNSEFIENEHGKAGMVSVTVTNPGEPTSFITKDWEIVVLCGVCGDQVGSGPLGLIEEEIVDDVDNSWNLGVEYQYYIKPSI